MAATIQTIQKPTRARALDTSGNNNHGQIYSGRALEFDGVTDYITHNGGIELDGVNNFAHGEPFTMSMWIYFEDDGQTWFIGNHDNTQPHLIYVAKRLQFRGAQASAPKFNFKKIGTSDNADDIPSKTWSRIAIVSDGTNLKSYINGELHGDINNGDLEDAVSPSLTFSDTSFQCTNIGAPYSGFNYQMFEGMMSDFQCWDAAWTADDASYDYLNPEQLALNRGGTSLTNSNLKIWYPMNDGHRGQQSYILDASNTGLGDELLTTTDLTTVGNATIVAGTTLNNWTHHATYQYDSVTASSDGIRIVSNGVNDLGSAYQSVHSNNFPTIEGVTYRFEYTAIQNSGGNMSLDATNNPVGSSIMPGGANTLTGSVTNEVLYFTADSSAEATCVIDFYISSTVAADWTISYVSIKPVNDKNYATTVFYGDDLWDGADDSVSNWVAGSGTSTHVASADCIKLTPATSTNGSYIQLRNTKDLTADLVIGRKYQVSYDSAGDIVGSESKMSVYDNASFQAASSTTTVANVVTNPAFETAGGGGADIWANWNEVVGSGALANETTNKHNGDDAAELETSSGNEAYIFQTVTGLTADSKYLLTFWSKNANASAAGDARFKVYDNDNGANLEINGTAATYHSSGNGSTSWAQFAGQFTTGSGNTSVNLYFKSPSGDHKVYIDDIILSAFETNTIDFTAGHATNCELRQQDAWGAEMITAVNDRNSIFDEVLGNLQWAIVDGGAGQAVSLAVTGGALVITTTTDNEAEGAFLPVANYTALVVGRSYIISATLSSNAGTPAINFRLGDSSVITQNINTTPTTYTALVTVVDITEPLKIYNTATHDFTITMDNVEIYPIENLWVDDISLKEVGLASGWTDADQQLDIPQTALQSYNQLAWFTDKDGVDSANQYLTVANHADFNYGASTDFSICGWVFTNDSVLQTYFMHKGGGGNQGWHIRIKADEEFNVAISDGSNQVSTDSTAVWTPGKWHHFAVTFDRNGGSDGLIIYHNGEVVGTADIDAVGDIDVSSSLIIGSYSDVYGNGNHIGSLNEISMWATKLSNTKIASIYNDGKALDVTTTYYAGYLKGYWRNTGLGNWINLDNPGTHDATMNNADETMLITAGADGSRDSQGFLMNRQRATNSLNLGRNTYSAVKNANSMQDTFRDSFTVGFWMKTAEGRPTNNEEIMGTADNFNEDYFVITMRTNGTIRCQYKANNDGFDKYSSAIIADTATGSWHYIVLTIEKNAANGLKFYIDGAFSSQENTSGITDGNWEAWTSKENLGIANIYDDGAFSSNYYFDGQLDDIVFYSDILELAEVKRNYNAGKRSHR